MRRLIFPVLLGLVGTGILIGLGVWQLQRLDWKEGVLARIDAMLAQDPVLLPAAPEPEADNYRQVIVEGWRSGAELHVLTSGTAAGSGYQVISAFETVEGRRIMIDQGLLAFDDKAQPPAIDAEAAPVTLAGTLLWPDDGKAAGQTRTATGNVWYGRDIARMAQALDTEEVLIVLTAASAYDDRLTPLPVDSSTITNDHLEYAITWFSLAFVWAAMSGYLITRVRRGKD